jgi:hypothetical protein
MMSSFETDRVSKQRNRTFRAFVAALIDGAQVPRHAEALPVHGYGGQARVTGAVHRRKAPEQVAVQKGRATLRVDGATAHKKRGDAEAVPREITHEKRACLDSRSGHREELEADEGAVKGKSDSLTLVRVG